MKSILSTGIVVLAIVAFLFCSTPAKAEDMVITFKPSSVSVLKDRNGNEYVRMIWGQEKELNGVKYAAGASVNAYRELAAQAKLYKQGDTVTAVVSKKDYNGTEYYTVLAFDKTKTAKK